MCLFEELKTLPTYRQLCCVIALLLYLFVVFKGLVYLVKGLSSLSALLQGTNAASLTSIGWLKTTTPSCVPPHGKWCRSIFDIGVEDHHLIITLTRRYGIAGYRMYFVQLNTPVFVSSVPEQPPPFFEVKQLTCSVGTPYVFSADGRLYIFKNGRWLPMGLDKFTDLLNEVKDIKMGREFGCMNIGADAGLHRFQTRIGTLKAKLVLYPVVDEDQHVQHINLLLHPKEENLEEWITLRLSYPVLSARIYSTPDMGETNTVAITNRTQGVKKVLGGILIPPVSFRTKGAANIELFFPRGTLEAIETHQLNNVWIASQTAAQNALTKTFLRDMMYGVLLILLTCTPLILLGLIYIIFGKEQPVVVPDELSFVPNPSRPLWMVSAVFSDGVQGNNMTKATKLTQALLFKMADKKIAKFKEKLVRFDDKKLADFMLSDDPDHEDIHKLIALIKNCFKKEKDGWYNLAEIAPNKEDVLARGIEELLSSSRMNRAWAQCMDTTGEKLAHFVLVLSAFVYLLFLRVFLFIPALCLFFGTFAFAIGTLRTGLFARWKKNYFKEFLHWQAFKRFLQDSAALEKYGVQDINMWRDWLIYGAALGVGGAVSKTFQQLVEKGAIPKNHLFYACIANTYYYPSINYALNASNAASPSPTGFSGGFGGGFGVGGGFGGFGGGCR